MSVLVDRDILEVVERGAIVITPFDRACLGTNGRSSLGRLGLSIHVTAGTGDRGFRGCWTMELFVIKRLRVYAGIPVGQLLWLTTESLPLVPYDQKPSAKYNDAGPLPQPSKLHEELGG